MTYKVYLAFDMLVQRQTYCFFGFIVNIYELILYKDTKYKLMFFVQGLNINICARYLT